MAFVKFSRGLLSVYNNLTRKDPDTLYLVYENLDSTYGSLYLGDKLISSISGSASNLSLGDLTNVSLPNELEDGMLLQYNASTGEGIWEAVPLTDIISGGGSSSSNNISLVESLNSIQNPSEKDIAIIGSDVYVYDGSDWVQLSNNDLAGRIADLESSVGHAADAEEGIVATGLYAELETLQSSLGNVYTKTEVNNYISQQIAAAQHLRYEVVSDISDINTTADEAEYTVYLVPKDEAETNNGYDEYFVVDEVLEKIGSWDIDSDRLLTEEQKKKLDSLDLDENDQVIIQAVQVGGLTQTIQDNQYIKSVAPGTFEVTSEGELQLKSVPSIDLSGYVQKTLYQSEVGDLNNLQNRVSNNSSLVDEINFIKTSIYWQELHNS